MGVAGAGVSGQLALYNTFAGWTMNRAGTIVINNIFIENQQNYKS